jgi:hypothetical protein
MATSKSKSAPSIDDKVQQLFAIVKQKKSEIEKAEKPNWVTNCSFRFTEDSTAAGSLNLQVQSDPKVIVGILAFLTEKSAHFTAASAELGLDLEFKWLGYTVEDWKTDLVTRLNKVQIKKKKDELELLESRLDKLVSPEVRAQMELEAIEKLLG